MPSILFIIYGTRFKILEDLIIKLNQSNQVLILFLNEPNNEVLQYLKNNNIIFFFNNESHKLSKIQYLITKFNKSDSSLHQLIIEKLYKLYYLYAYIESFLLFKKYNISCVYSHNDRYEDSTISYLKMAYDFNIPIIIPSQHPIEIDQNHFNNNHKTLRYDYSNASIYQKIIFKIFKTRNPKQLENGYFYYPAPIMKALDSFDVLPPNPWLVGSSKLTTKVIVSNNANKSLLKKYSINHKKIEVLGCLDYDKLYLNKSKVSQKIIVFTLTHFYEHNYMTLEKAKKEHEFVLNNLSQLKEYTIIISLAPMMEKSTYIYLEKKYNCKISAKPLNELLPLASLYICSYSTTIYWSVILGIKTIVLSYHGLKYNLLSEFKSVLYIENKELFLNKLTHYINKKNSFFNDYAYLNKSELFNGKVIESYEKLTKRMQNVNFNKNFRCKCKSNFFFEIYYKINFYYTFKFYSSYFHNFKFKQYYMAPYSNLTISLSMLIKEKFDINFLGFFDNFKIGYNIYKCSETNITNDTAIIIYSPNHYNSIKLDILQYCDKNQIITIDKN